MTSLAADGTPNNTPVGYFTYVVDDDYWAWSAGLHELHGYEPHEVEVTTDLILRHKHPADAARALGVLEDVLRDAAPFSCYHRIIDAQGLVRSVLSVGRGLLAAHGRVKQVTGFFVDLTEVRRSETQHEVDEALLQVAKERAVVEQAKGIVMVEAGCDADEALVILRQSSSGRNVKLSELSEQLVESVSNPAPNNVTARHKVVLDLLWLDSSRQSTSS